MNNNQSILYRFHFVLTMCAEKNRNASAHISRTYVSFEEREREKKKEQKQHTTQGLNTILDSRTERQMAEIDTYLI